MQKEETVHGEAKEKRNVLTSIIVGGVGAFSAFYLFNPGAGVLELIPDNIPFIGNLDEAGAAAILISCLAYFGVDIGGLFGRKKKEEKSDVIDVEAQE